jgi:hypothetical protein
LKELRDNRRDRLVKSFLSKKYCWTKFYEIKAGIRFQDLHLTQDLSFGEKNVESYLILFLNQVDIFSTIVVKKAPETLQSGSSKTQNSDILRHAAKSFKSIYQDFWLKKDDTFRKKFNPHLHFKYSTLMALRLVQDIFLMWLERARIEGHEKIPFLMYQERPFSMFFEDISFYTLRSLDYSISNFDFLKYYRTHS